MTVTTLCAVLLLQTWHSGQLQLCCSTTHFSNCEDRALWENVRHLSFAYNKAVTTDTVTRALSYCECLEGLDLDYTAVTGEVLLQLTASHHRLTHLNFSGCRGIDEDDLPCLYTYTQLVSLRLPHCPYISTNRIFTLLGYLPHLQALTFTLIEPDPEKIPLQHQFCNIRRLDVGCTFPQKWINCAIVTRLQVLFPDVLWLVLHGCIFDVAGIIALTTFPRVQQLELFATPITVEVLLRAFDMYNKRPPRLVVHSH
eukprot:TRINITY_DN66599_c0_g3_i3.p1 TRINITY_DN66599_c0_g3~~TRINITY_DN66599_c0_g3_i3.p1  ORF type:complete len:255 (-),score=7.82 TRINITY_DN66599_c0_g3_i3:798-1562(-)